MAALLGLATCVPPPRPVAPPAPLPPPRIAPPAPALGTDWRDWPLTPGAWTYLPGAAGAEARFGRSGEPPDFAVRCDAGSRRVVLRRAGAVAWGTPPTLTVTTSAGVMAWRTGGEPSVALAAADSFLDKMAFSRGRFIVETTGLPRLVIPSWPEFARVVEDCRE